MHSESLPNPSAKLDSICQYTVVESSQATTNQRSQSQPRRKKRKNTQTESNESDVDELNRSMSQLCSSQEQQLEIPARKKRARKAK